MPYATCGITVGIARGCQVARKLVGSRRVLAIPCGVPVVCTLSGITLIAFQILSDFSVDRLRLSRQKLAIEYLPSDRVPERKLTGSIAHFFDKLRAARAREHVAELDDGKTRRLRQQLGPERSSDDGCVE